MIGTAVVVDINGHVAAHLSALHVAHQEETLLDGFAPLRRPPSLIVFAFEGQGRGFVFFLEICWPAPSIGAQRTHEAERPFDLVCHGKACSRRSISFSAQFEVEEHDIFSRLRVFNHLRTLHDAA